MLLCRQPGDTGIYATATPMRVSVYDLSRSGSGPLSGLASPITNAAATTSRTDGGAFPVQGSASRGTPPPLRDNTSGVAEAGGRAFLGGPTGTSFSTPSSAMGGNRVDVYTTFHPRWGYPIRPALVFPVDCMPPSPLPSRISTSGVGGGYSTPDDTGAAFTHITSNGGVNNSNSSAGFLPTSLSLSCATDKPLFFLSGDGPGSGWIGSCHTGQLATLTITASIGKGASRDYHGGEARGGTRNYSNSATARRPGAAHLPVSQPFVYPSSASSPHPSAAPTLRQQSSGCSVRAIHPSTSPQSFGGDGVARAVDAGEDVEVSSSNDSDVAHGGGGDGNNSSHNNGGRGPPASGSRLWLAHLSTTTLADGNGTGMGEPLPLPLPLPRPRARVLGPVTASGWDPRSAATLALGRLDGIVQLLDAEYLIGGVDESRGGMNGRGHTHYAQRDGGHHETHSGRAESVGGTAVGSLAATAASSLTAPYSHEGEQHSLRGNATAAPASSTSRPLHYRNRHSQHQHQHHSSTPPFSTIPAYHVAQVHGSTVQERQLSGQVTAIDWLPQSHTTVVAARRQDGLGYYAELLDLRSPESAVRYLGAPPDALGTPFYLPGGSVNGAGGAISDGSLGGVPSGSGGGAGVSPYVLCYSEHIACDPSRQFVATVGTQQSKDIVQVWDVRMTTRPFAQRVFARVGYTSLCWSMADPLTVVGATRSGELRVHSFAERGRGLTTMRSCRQGADGGVAVNEAEEEEDEEGDVDFLAGGRVRHDGVDGPSSLRKSHRKGCRAYEDSDDDEDDDTARAPNTWHLRDTDDVNEYHSGKHHSNNAKDRDGGSESGDVDDRDNRIAFNSDDATPSGTSFIGTATTASSLTGEALGSTGAGAATSGGGDLFSPRVKARPTHANRLPARVPAVAAAWAPPTPSETAGAAHRKTDPGAYPVAQGSRLALPRLVLLNPKNGELYEQVYDRVGSTVAVRDGVPLASAGPNVFSMTGARAALVDRERRQAMLLAELEGSLAALRCGGVVQKVADPMLLRVVRVALSPPAIPTAGKGTDSAAIGGGVMTAAGVAGGGLGKAALGAGAGLGAAAISAAGAAATGSATTTGGGAPVSIHGGGRTGTAEAAKDYTGIDLLDNEDDEDDDGGDEDKNEIGSSVSGHDSRSTGAGTAVASSSAGGGGGGGIGEAASGSALNTILSGVHGGGGGGGASQDSFGLPYSPGISFDTAVTSTTPNTAAAVPTAAANAMTTGPAVSMTAAGEADAAVPFFLRAQLMRGVSAEDIPILTYLLEVLPLCATAAFTDRRGMALSRLASGFATDPSRNLRVLQKEGTDREAYAAFLYGVTLAAHLYGTRDAPAELMIGTRDGGKQEEEESVVVPVTHAVPGMLELLVAEHRERERLGLLHTPLPSPDGSIPQGAANSSAAAASTTAGHCDLHGGMRGPPLSLGIGSAGAGGIPWPRLGMPPAGLPSVLPAPRFRSPFGTAASAAAPSLPPPGVPGQPNSTAAAAAAAAAEQSVPHARLGFLRELLLVSMGWLQPSAVGTKDSYATSSSGKQRKGITEGAGAGARSRISHADSTAATPAGVPRDTFSGGGTHASTGELGLNAEGHKRRTLIVLPNAQPPHRRRPQSFFLEGDGIAMSSLQECIERRVCVLTVMEQLSEAAALLALYGAYHPLYPSTALELASAAARQQHRRSQDRIGHATRSGGTGGSPVVDPGPVWQRTVGCTFWLALALTYVDSIVAVATAAINTSTSSAAAAPGPAEAASGNVEKEADASTSASPSSPSREWSMACLSLSDQRRFVVSLLRCFPRVPLPDVIGLATALLLPPRYTADHLDNLVEVLKALVHQQYEHGCVPAHDSSTFTLPMTAAGAGATVSLYSLRPHPDHNHSRNHHPPTTLPLPVSASSPTTGGGGGVRCLRPGESTAQLRAIMAPSSRCSFLLTAAVESVGLETAALQRYIDETADVQTPVCYAAAFGSTQSSTFRAWRDAYRAQLNAGGHFMLRSQHDLCCLQTLRARCALAATVASGGGGVGGIVGVPAGLSVPPGLLSGGGGGVEGGRPVPFPSIGTLADLKSSPGVGEALDHMMKRTLGALSGGRPAPGVVKGRPGASATPNAPGGPLSALVLGPGGGPTRMRPGAAAAAAGLRNLTDPARSVELRCNCGQAMHASAPSKATTATSAAAVAAASSSHVRKQLLPCGNPECRQWQTPMCTVCGERMESRAVELPPERSFVWCTVCLHGGHYCHVGEWFAKHAKCPVEDCPCRCCDGSGF